MKFLLRCLVSSIFFHRVYWGETGMSFPNIHKCRVQHVNSVSFLVTVQIRY